MLFGKLELIFKSHFVYQYFGNSYLRPKEYILDSRNNSAEARGRHSARKILSPKFW